MSNKTNWVLIPPVILDNQKLNSTDKLVFGKVFGLSNQKGFCYASNDYIAEDLGVSKDSVKMSLKKLYKLGVLRYELLRKKSNEVAERRIYVIMGGVGENITIGRVKGRVTFYPTSLDKDIKEDNVFKISAEHRKQIMKKLGKIK